MTPEPQQPEQTIVRSSPRKKRPGETPTALFIKALFRPIIKLLYYILTGIRTHVLLTIGVIVLLALTISTTMFFTTGQLPLGVGSDPYNFHIHGQDGGGTQVQNWLFALRDGDVTQLSFLEKNMSQPPDPTQLVSQYSPTKTHLTWKAEHVIGTYQESDTTVDSFVQIDLSATGPGGPTTGELIWHFVTVSSNGQDLLLAATVIDSRASLM
jgi:hypothetical protein